MITIYHFTGARSQRVIWLCEELGLEYDLKLVDHAAGELTSDAFRQISPLAKLPCIVDQENGQSLFESGAIIQYITHHYDDGGLVPEIGSDVWIKYIQWFSAAETFMYIAMPIMHHTMLRPKEKRVAALADEGRTKLAVLLDGLNTSLEGQKFITGDDFSAADIMLGYSLRIIYILGAIEDETQPNVAAYFERLKTRPAFQKATA